MHVVVVGGGILGLASARALQHHAPGIEVTVLEKEGALATHQSGRNSGVLHSGIYYAPGSAKARLVAEGRQAMQRYCAERSIPVDLCGKVIVATRAAEVGRLAELEARARANGIPVRALDRAGLAEREPWVSAIAAIEVPSTGVLDYRAVCAALALDIEEAGGEIRLATEVRALDEPTAGRGRPGVRVTTAGGVIDADAAVVCAGLHADRVARRLVAGRPSGPSSVDVRILPFRGEYHELAASAAHLVQGLVYPVPDPAFPFLGVHLTRGIDGHVHVGPNAVPAFGREAYRWGAPSLVETAEIASRPGTWRLARRYWRTGLAEIHRSIDRRALLAAVRLMVPDVGPGDLLPAGAGIRAQAVDGTGRLLDDFAFADTPATVVVHNAPSPAATASLAIGDEIARRLLRRVAPFWCTP